MTVKEFKNFCRSQCILLRDSYTGRVYTKLDNYLDKEVTGFYPRFKLSGNDGYAANSRIQIVAWIEHDFDEDDGKG